MTIKGFTKADNHILFNSKLSNDAKIIYFQILYYSNIPNFKASKYLLLKDSQISVNTFSKYIKILREMGLIVLHTEREGKKNVYWYSANIKPVENQEESKSIDESTITGAEEKKEVIKKSRQERIDNHENVRLVRSLEKVNIDKSKTDKDILTFADVNIVRNVVRNFKKQAKSHKNKSFFTAKTIRNMLIKEYYDNELDFNPIMLKKLNSISDIPLLQYSEISIGYMKKINRELGYED